MLGLMGTHYDEQNYDKNINFFWVGKTTIVSGMRDHKWIQLGLETNHKFLIIFYDSVSFIGPLFILLLTTKARW